MNITTKMKKMIIMAVVLSMAFVFPLNAFADNGENIETTKGEKPLNVTVKIPLTTEEDKNTIKITGDSVGKEIIAGDRKEGDNDSEYNYSIYKVIKQGAVTITTTSIHFINNFRLGDEYVLEYVKSDAVPNGKNHLSNPGSKKEVTLPDNTVGYDYIFAGSGNISQYCPNYLFNDPNNDDPKDENGNPKPAFTYKGQGYYFNHGHIPNTYLVYGGYFDGERINKDTKYNARYDTAQQFNLTEINNGKLSNNVCTTYCAERGNGTIDGYLYKINNLEEADYYDDEHAAMIRTVAYNGYWGDNEYGSLDDIKNMMQKAKDENGQRVFTDDDIDKVTDGIAMTATQMAIWTYSNFKEGITFLNASYSTQKSGFKYGSREDGKSTPGYYDNMDLIFKLYEYFIQLEPTAFEEADTSNTVIDENYFLDDMSMTINSKTGDSYNVDIYLKPSVKVKKNNDDDLVITLLGGDDPENPEVLFTGRIAGNIQPGEKLLKLNDDDMYVLEDIEISEGEQIMAIQYNGHQNLDKNVYLFQSENREGQTSQTLVGVAEGKKAVDITMYMGFMFSAEDEMYEKTRIFKKASNDGGPDTGDVFTGAIAITVALIMMTTAAIVSIRRKV